MVHFLDEGSIQKPGDLLADGPPLFFVKAAQSLLHRAGARFDMERVLGDLPRYARHV
jgi:hypothetical protein